MLSKHLGRCHASDGLPDSTARCLFFALFLGFAASAGGAAASSASVIIGAASWAAVALTSAAGGASTAGSEPAGSPSEAALFGDVGAAEA